MFPGFRVWVLGLSDHSVPCPQGMGHCVGTVSDHFVPSPQGMGHCVGTVSV